MEKTTESEHVTLESLEEQIQSLSGVAGLILLLLAGYPFPRTFIEEVARACGVHPAGREERGH